MSGYETLVIWALLSLFGRFFAFLGTTFLFGVLLSSSGCYFAFFGATLLFCCLYEANDGPGPRAPGQDPYSLTWAAPGPLAIVGNLHKKATPVC